MKRKMETRKILVIGDGVTKTGFSTVIHNILQNLPPKEFDIYHLAINYFGDPHSYNWKIYPAATKGDALGINRLVDFSEIDFQGIFILNDVWVIDRYLHRIKEVFREKIPPIIVYFPVDAKELDISWFNNFDIVFKTVVYTQFGYDEVIKAKKIIEPTIIPHGVDSKTFYKMNLPKRTLKKKLYPNTEDFLDSFIILNANRNQPRKRIDLFLEGFALFAEDKPSNVKAYCHMGIRDTAIDVIKLVHRLNIDKRLIITNTKPGPQQVSEDKLNLIYNCSEVSVNTALGEGFSLSNAEHAATGGVQIVAEHSALKELYSDCGLLIPINQWLINQDVITVGGLVRPEDVAVQLEKLYADPQLYSELSAKSLAKFTDQKYQWPVIVEQGWLPLFEKYFS